MCVLSIQLVQAVPSQALVTLGHAVPLGCSLILDTVIQLQLVRVNSAEPEIPAVPGTLLRTCGWAALAVVMCMGLVLGGRSMKVCCTLRTERGRQPRLFFDATERQDTRGRADARYAG